MNQGSLQRSLCRRALVLTAALAFVAVAAAGPLRPQAAAAAATPTVELVPNTSDPNRPIPSDLKQTCITGPGATASSSTCPVLKFGAFTYWAYSFKDNRVAMAIVAYGPGGSIAQRWDRTGDRYIWEIRVDASAQTVRFVGQYEGETTQTPIVFTWAELELTAPADTTPPVLNLPAAITTNATGPSGAVVSYMATATDSAPPNPAVSCQPASGSSFPIGTTTVSCSATDAAGNTARGSFPVTVKGATAQLSDLEAATTGLAPLDSLARTARLARQAAEAGRTTEACRSLSAFLVEVTGLRFAGRLSAAQAQQFTADATRIRAVLGCG